MADRQWKDKIFDPNGLSFTGSYTKLQKAVDNEDLSRVKSLILSGADINGSGLSSIPGPFLLALEGNSLLIIDFFLSKEVSKKLNINEMTYGTSGRSIRKSALSCFLRRPRGYGGRQNRQNILEKLLKLGANPFQDLSQRYNQIVTPFHIVIENEDMDAIELLCTQPNIDLKKKINGKTLAHIAVERKRYSALKEILKYEPSLLNEKDRNGVTPLLYMAGQASMSDLLPYLRDKNSDLTAKDADNAGILHYLRKNRAIDQKQRISMTRLCLSRGVNICQKTSNGDTLLHYLIERVERKSDIVLIQTALGALSKEDREQALSLKDREGKTPFSKAVERYISEGGRTYPGRTDQFRYLTDILLTNGSDLNSADTMGYTVLDRLAEKEERDSLMVQYLLKNGGTYNKFFDADEIYDLKRKLKGEHVKYKHVLIKKPKSQIPPHFKK